LILAGLVGSGCGTAPRSPEPSVTNGPPGDDPRRGADAATGAVVAPALDAGPLGGPVADAAGPVGRVSPELSIGNAELSLSRFEPSLAIRADGRRVVLLVHGSNDGGVAVLFDPATGAELTRWVPASGTGYARGYHTAQFLPDGRILATDRSQLFVLAEDGTATALWPVDGTVLASPDGAWVASQHRDQLTIRALAAGSRGPGKPAVVLRGVRTVQSLAFTHDGTRLVVVRNQASGDLPTGDTEVVWFDRRGVAWRRAGAATLPGARQENDAAFLSRDRLLVDDLVLDLPTGAATPSGAPGLRALSADATAVLLHTADGSEPQWARVVDGQLGPRAPTVRPPAFADRGHAMAVSPRGEVLWCTGTRCILGPPPP